jgi:glucosylceramidase
MRARVAAASGPGVSVVETTGTQSELLSSLPGLQFASGSASAPATITVNANESYQPVGGFGATLNDVDAYLLMESTSATVRQQVLTELFSPTSGIGLDYVRIPIGGNNYSQSSYSANFPESLSDAGNFTEDDTPGDTSLAKFNIAHDEKYLIPVLQQIRAINPRVQIIASPWTAPAWMKSGGSSASHGLDGGSLYAADDSLYSQYLVKFAQDYAGQGIPISAISVQNEPNTPTTFPYPAMTMPEAQEQIVAGDTAQGLKQAGFSTQVLGLDHNWSYWQSYAKPLLANQPNVTGTAFHCYTGGPANQGQLEADFPSRTIFETECTPLGGKYGFGTDLVNNTLTEGIEGIQDWSQSMMFWNLVLDIKDGPTTDPAACPAPGVSSSDPHQPCLPVMTVTSVSSAKTVAYYTLGQFSQFVQPGAVRICSYTTTSSVSGKCPPGSGAWPVSSAALQSVAFRDPNGKIVLVVLNRSSGPQTVAVDWNGDSFTEPQLIPPSSVQTFEWQGPTPTWYDQRPKTSPSPLADASMATDSATSQLVLFGGGQCLGSSCSVSNQTWTWARGGWVMLSPEHNPPARSEAAMAYDPASRQIVLFGGYNANNENLGDTWVWNGTDWTQESGALDPSARHDAVLGYDPVSQRLILFGGSTSFDGTPLSPQTWAWDGTGWQELKPAQTPSGLSAPALVTDTATSQLILFGGDTDGSYTPASDTWTWTGTNWTMLTPPGSPPARFRATATMDPDTNSVVLFGGYGSNLADLGDTWSWNGKTWTEISTTGPSPRADSALGFDSDSEQLLLFGGSQDEGSTLLGDTWSHR